MLYIVDGTGAFFEDEYQLDMGNSFCRRLEKQGNGIYMRGPSIDGLSTFRRGKIVAFKIMAARVTGTADEPIFLAGHSRGGAAVIHAAQLLDVVGIKVKAMFLYDAVDRTVDTDIDVSSIPANVASCYHARRYPHLAQHLQKDVTASLKDLEKVRAKEGERSTTYMRKKAVHDMLAKKDWIIRELSRSENITESGYLSIDFGNCGVSGAPPCRYQQMFFLGTHGAIGGAPKRNHGVKELEDIDRAAMAAVDGWMSGKLAMEGVLGAV